MSTVISWTRIAGLDLVPQLFSGDQEGSLGGASLPIPRMGDRFTAKITTTKFQADDESREFLAALFEASTNDGRILLRQPNLTRTIYAGKAVVDGAGQAGSSIAMRGLGSTTLLRGQFFSIVHNGIHHVHMVTAKTVAVGGRAVVPIWPMLRFITIDGEPCALTAPMVEGKLVGFEGASFVRNRVQPISFSIVERA